MPSNFDFLQSSRPEFHESAVEAESLIHISPRSACVTARFCLERAVLWLYEHDDTLRPLHDTNLATLIYEHTFFELTRGLATPIRLVHKLGNTAAHEQRKILAREAEGAVSGLFAFLHWLASYYGEQANALPRLAFRADLVPRPDDGKKKVELTLAQVSALEQQLAAKEAELAAQRDGLAEQLARARAHEHELTAALELLAAAQADLVAGEALLDENVVALDVAQRTAQAKAAELARREAELTEARSHAEALRVQLDAQRQRFSKVRAARAATDPLDFNEAETRAQLIDVLLREAGWPVDDPKCLEVPLTFTSGGNGRADYVFWGADGQPIAVIEAKKASVDIEKGKNQAMLYADALALEHGQRPVMFYTNGLEIMLWDDARGYPPRMIAGFYTAEEVTRLIARRASEQPLADVAIDDSIAGREYQLRAIRAVAESLDRQRRRRALLVMATGTGKTRVAVALVDLLQRAGWARRVLFLADRLTLVDQARKAFKRHMPHSKVVVLTETDDDGSAPILISTYPTLLNAVERPDAGRRAYSPGAFDLVIVDEAHRSVYQRYGALIEYFDGRLLGLTATPRDEVARDTYGLFHLHAGLPTFAYELADAVSDGWLVPARGKSVPFRFLTQGIVYDELSAEEREEFESKLTEDDGTLPHQIDPGALNRWLYNDDTIDKALAFIMAHAIKVDRGERIGKTIIFARNVEHAKRIILRFDRAYSMYAGKLAKRIVSADPYSQDLVDNFVAPESPEKAFSIAVSVDMLDTGVDVPDVVNLVFFKPVFSKIKYHQMIGRGTRLCKDLFGPGQDKTEFLVFDLCGVLDFFGQADQMPERETPLVATPSTRLFRGRLELIRRLVARKSRTPGEATLLETVRNDLHRRVAAMQHENFFVRPQWSTVQRYVDRSRWDRLDAADLQDIGVLAELPTNVDDDGSDARDFDIRCVALQLALLESSKKRNDQIEAMIDLLGALAQRKAVPQVAAKLDYIRSLVEGDAWANATVDMVERVRIELRDLIRFIDHRRSTVIYTNFTDTLLTSAVEDRSVPIFPATGDAYRNRVTQFIRDHGDHLAIAKLRTNKPLTTTDLDALEELLLRADVGESRAKLSALYGSTGSLTGFIRSLVGLDRAATNEAFAGFLSAPGRTLTSAQAGFVRQIVDYLTARGTMEVGALYEPPFTDTHAAGPEGLFSEPDIASIVQIIQAVNDNARPPMASEPASK
ncbi:DEAD/DEAH box helicase family protein [Nannocystaceae bacterium ST9]